MKGLFLTGVIFSSSLLYGNLVERSPFVPYDYKARAGNVPQGGALEFRGVLDLGEDDLQFSLYDKSKNKSVWVKLKDPEAEYYVEGYNPMLNTIEISSAGSSKQLMLKKPEENKLSSFDLNTTAQEEKTPEEAEGEEPKEEMTPEKRKEMAKRVFDAFRKYVRERQAKQAEESGASNPSEEGSE